MIWLVLAILPYLIVFLTVFISLRKNSRPASASEIGDYKDLPPVTVVIPVKDEEENLMSLLEDISSQDYPRGRFEVIVVDDDSNDRTREIALSMSVKHKMIRLISSQGRGKKHAIATALDNTENEFIISIDGDCRAGISWLRSMTGEMMSEEADMIIGQVDIINTDRLLNRLVQLDFLSLQAVSKAFALKGNPIMCNGANLLFKNPGKKDYLEMVKTEIASGDDIFLMEGFRRKGKKISWAESAGSLVKTAGPGNISGFLRQRIRWASKSTAYRDPLLIAIAILVFLSCSLLVFSLVISFLNPVFLISSLLLYIIKSVPDYLLIRTMAEERDKPFQNYLFMVAQIIYPFYVVIAGISGLIKGLFFSRPGK